MVPPLVSRSDVTITDDPSGGLQSSAVKCQRSGGFAQIVVVADRNDSVVKRGSALIDIRTVQSQGFRDCCRC